MLIDQGKAKCFGLEHTVGSFQEEASPQLAPQRFKIIAHRSQNFVGGPVLSNSMPYIILCSGLSTVHLTDVTTEAPEIRLYNPSKRANGRGRILTQCAYKAKCSLWVEQNAGGFSVLGVEIHSGVSFHPPCLLQAHLIS